jgi:hypothetical protein
MIFCTLVWAMWPVGAATIAQARVLEIAAILTVGSTPNMGASASGLGSRPVGRMVFPTTSAHGVNRLGEPCCADDRLSDASTPASARDRVRSLMTRSMGRGDPRDRTAESLNPRDSQTIA